MTYVDTPQSSCLCGAARGDITPAVGIYHRMWGAATHDRATGIHRPLSATVVCLSPADTTSDEPWVLVSLDHCLFWPQEMSDVLDGVARGAQISRERLLITFSHTHGAGLMGYERLDLPGGDLIPEYLRTLATRVAELIADARRRMQPATIAYAAGQCDLATNRDFWDEERKQFVCGFNPNGQADRTVLVARISGTHGEIVATMVNYACHPTSLAWENTQISPDYPGAMDEVIQQAMRGPCLFLQGASGDIGPREGFVGSTAVADRNGRQLGYAALSALTALPPPATRFQYMGPVVSGATLGVWTHVQLPTDRQRQLATWHSKTWTIDLPYRADLPTCSEAERDLAHWQHQYNAAMADRDGPRARDARAMVERQTRLLTRLATLPSGKSYPFPITLWRLGDAVWVFVEGEHYNVLQTALRARFPGVPIVVTTLVNGSRVFYVCPADAYDKGLYQESVAVLAPGSLETLIADIGREIEALLKSD